MTNVPHITCEHLLQLESKKEKEHIILDIRDQSEYEAGHIKDAHNIPRHELATNIHTVIPEKDKRVVVIVGPTHEPEIERVHETLAELGYTNVEFLAGGFDKWCEIAPVELEADLLDETPEEAGSVGDGSSQVDPEVNDNEPLY